MKNGPLAGSNAIDFDLPDLDGQQHTLRDGIGNWQLLVFHRHLG